MSEAVKEGTGRTARFPRGAMATSVGVVWTRNALGKNDGACGTLLASSRLGGFAGSRSGAALELRFSTRGVGGWTTGASDFFGEAGLGGVS